MSLATSQFGWRCYILDRAAHSKPANEFQRSRRCEQGNGHSLVFNLSLVIGERSDRPFYRNRMSSYLRLSERYVDGPHIF